MNNIVNIEGIQILSFLGQFMWVNHYFAVWGICLLILTSLLRTARKQPLLSSEGCKMKKESFFFGPSAWWGMLNGDGISLDETHIHANRKIQYMNICIKASAKKQNLTQAALPKYLNAHKSTSYLGKASVGKTSNIICVLFIEAWSNVNTQGWLTAVRSQVYKNGKLQQVVSSSEFIHIHTQNNWKKRVCQCKGKLSKNIFFLPFSQHLETWNGTFDYIFTELPSVPVWSVPRLWQKPVWRETDKQPSRLIDSKAKRKKRDKCRECGEGLRYRGWGWPEVRLFWFSLLLWACLGLLKSSAHHLLVLLWVCWTGRVYHCDNLWDYRKKNCAWCQHTLCGIIMQIKLSQSLTLNIYMKTNPKIYVIKTLK